MTTEDWMTVLAITYFAALVAILIIINLCMDGKRRHADFSAPAPDVPAPDAPAWRSHTSARASDGEPWFLVVYDAPCKVSLALAASDVICLVYNDTGDICIRLKRKFDAEMGTDVSLKNQYSFEFLPASRMGDLLVNLEESEKKQSDE